MRELEVLESASGITLIRRQISRFRGELSDCGVFGSKIAHDRREGLKRYVPD